MTAAGGGLRIGELAQVAGEQHPGLERERLTVEILESAGGEAGEVFVGYHRLLADPRLAGPAMAAYRRGGRHHAGRRPGP